MSLVLVVSRGILASTSPASNVSPSCTIKCACDGLWYLLAPTRHIANVPHTLLLG